MFALCRNLFVLFCLASVNGLVLAEHTVLLHGKTGLVKIEPNGDVSWRMDWGGIHDIHQLDNGLLLTREGRTGVVEINPATKKVVWRYDSAKANGNEGKPVEVHAFERLENGLTMIAESGIARIIEVDRQGVIQHSIPLVVDNPSTHSDTRLVRSTSQGTYLVAHEADGKVREYDRASGEVIWEYEVPMFGKDPKPGHGPEAYGNRLFAALRLDSGNTLIATGNGHGVIEVTPEKKVVWQIQQDDLEGIRLAWVTTLEVLPENRIVIGNCHAGPGQPLLVELDRESKKVLWTLDGHQSFGNNVSNSLLVDMVGQSLR